MSNEINKERSNYLNDQTVIYILSESFSDPRKVEGVELTENPIPNIENIYENPHEWSNAFRWLWWWNSKYGVSNFNKFAIL